MASPKKTPPHASASSRFAQLPGWRGFAALVVAGPVLALAAPAARLEARAQDGDKPSAMANPIEQRMEMIALLRSIDAHLKIIEDSLAAKSK